MTTSNLVGTLFKDLCDSASTCCRSSLAIKQHSQYSRERVNLIVC